MHSPSPAHPLLTCTSARQGCPFSRVRARAQRRLFYSYEQLAAASTGPFNCGHDWLPHSLHMFPVLTPPSPSVPTRGPFCTPTVSTGLSVSAEFGLVSSSSCSSQCHQLVPSHAAQQGEVRMEYLGPPKPAVRGDGHRRDATTENKHQDWRFQLLLEKPYTK